jgi:hypothetical protein
MENEPNPGGIKGLMELACPPKQLRMKLPAGHVGAEGRPLYQTHG